MIAHVTAAALLNEAKVLAHPASVDSVPTSGGKEDHVSMGMTAALKLRQIVENAEMVLGIELMSAAQALEFRLPLKAARQVEAARARVRSLLRRCARIACWQGISRSWRWRFALVLSMNGRGAESTGRCVT